VSVTHAPDCDACCREIRSCTEDASLRRIASNQLELVTRICELEAALIGVLGAIDDKGFMTPEQQLALYRARKAVGK